MEAAATLAYALVCPFCLPSSIRCTAPALSVLPRAGQSPSVLLHRPANRSIHPNRIGGTVSRTRRRCLHRLEHPLEEASFAAGIGRTLVHARSVHSIGNPVVRP